ncbi:MAG: hypothetical protein HOP30_18825 [Cyclobacteriaceae bacterium]|nr:hypothetical protein [Cyclobacteriaceae bacterium]
MPKKISRYASAFLRVGYLDGSLSGMEWMDREYDSRTLKEVTQSCSVSEFCNELLAILLIGTPNLSMLCYSWGVFDRKENFMISKVVFNKLISEIAIHPLDKTTAFKDELGRITINFAQTTLSKQDVLNLFTLHKIEIEHEDDLELTTIPTKVKRIPLDEYVDMMVKVKMRNDWVNMIDIWYE